jgi:hypothetical protein
MTVTTPGCNGNIFVQKEASWNFSDRINCIYSKYSSIEHHILEINTKFRIKHEIFLGILL